MLEPMFKVGDRVAMLEPMFKVGDRVRKQGGDYGGPGVVVGVMTVEKEDGLQHVRYVVAHKIEGGYGRFLHIYGPGQVFKDMGEPVPLDIQADIARQQKAFEVTLDGKNEVIDKQRQRINELEDQVLTLKGERARWQAAADDALATAKAMSDKNVRLDKENGKLRDEIQILQQGINGSNATIRNLTECIDKIREVTNNA